MWTIFWDRKKPDFRMVKIERHQPTANYQLFSIGRNKRCGGTTFITISFIGPKIAFSPLSVMYGGNRLGGKHENVNTFCVGKILTVIVKSSGKLSVSPKEVNKTLNLCQSLSYSTWCITGTVYESWTATDGNTTSTTSPTVLHIIIAHTVMSVCVRDR